jgi:hypothetical protein
MELLCPAGRLKLRFGAGSWAPDLGPVSRLSIPDLILAVLVILADEVTR